MVNREVVGAHYGLRDWLAQRVTAIVMAVYTLLFACSLGSAPALDFNGWRAVFAPQWMKLATLLFLVSLFWHAWVGVRNIFMDYIKPSSLRLIGHVAAILWLIGCAGWSLQILWAL